MHHRALVITFGLLLPLTLSAQELIPLWADGKIPNSRGVNLRDSIANERIVRVGAPAIYAFFPSSEENRGTAVLVIPGGGYEREAFVKSGVQIAKWLNTLGVNAFVLKYRLPWSPDVVQRELAPLQDAQRALRIIRGNATKWGIRPEKIGALGSSAGGHLAATLGALRDDVSAAGDSLDPLTYTPDFLILVSPVITMGALTHDGSRNNLLGPSPSPELVRKYSCELQITSSTPPAFIVHALNDRTVPVQNSMMFVQACLEHRVPASLHIFPEGGHSIGLRNNPGSTALWLTLCELWLQESGFLSQAAGPRPLEERAGPQFGLLPIPPRGISLLSFSYLVNCSGVRIAFISLAVSSRIFCMVARIASRSPLPSANAFLRASSCLVKRLRTFTFCESLRASCLAS